MALLAALLLGAMLLGAMPLGALPRTAGAAGAPPSPPGIAVFPFEARRANGQWLAEFIGQGLRDSLRYSGGRQPLVAGPSAALWAEKFGLAGLTAPQPEQMAEGGFSLVVQGTAHLVLELASVRMRLTTAQGGGAVREFSFNLSADSPQQLLAALLASFPPPGKGEARFSPAPQPLSWAAVRDYHRLLRTTPPVSQREALRRHLALLESAGALPAMRGRVAALTADLLLREAVLGTAPPATQQEKFLAALGHVERALVADPWHSDRLALKGEIQYFLRRDFEARTDASVARLKNSRNGLAYFVLALAAGLSTGEAAEMMERALTADPFLALGNRPPGAGAFQEGALEPLLSQWRRLRETNARRRSGAASPQMAEAVRQFEAGRWREAELAFRALAKTSEDFRVPLYRARILIQTERSADAVAALKILGTEYPQEPEIFYFLGIALQRTGAYVAAEKAFKTSLGENPAEPRYLYGLATAEVALEYWERARLTLETLLAKDARHEQGWLAYGIVQFNLGQWQEADEAFQKVLALHPGSPEARDWRARTQARQGR